MNSVWQSFVSISRERAHLFFDLYTVLCFQDEGHCLHYLLPMRTHDLVYVLTSWQLWKKKSKQERISMHVVDFWGFYAKKSSYRCFNICRLGKKVGSIQGLCNAIKVPMEQLWLQYQTQQFKEQPADRDSLHSDLWQNWKECSLAS